MNHHYAHQHYDAIVCGARVAGAATALLLARAGWRVLLIDRAPAGTDALSTNALMRPAVLQLQRWGLLHQLQRYGVPAIRRTTFHYERSVTPIAITPQFGVEALYAPPRRLLDAVLVRAAHNAGAEVHHLVSLVDLLRTPQGRVCGAKLRHQDGSVVRLSADWVIGADGIGSRVARLTGSQIYHREPNQAAVVYGDFSGIDPDVASQGTHWYFGHRGAAGVIPTGKHTSTVFVGVPAAEFKPRLEGRDAYWRLLRQFEPAAYAELKRNASTAIFRGFAGREGFLRQCFGPGWALVGDAGCFKDPMTAHGITDALRDAELLARSLLLDTPGALEDYRAQRDAFAIPLLSIASTIAAFDSNDDQLSQVHRRLSREMNREAELIASWGRTPSLSRAAQPTAVGGLA